MREAKPGKPILFGEVAGFFDPDPPVRITVFKKGTPSIVEVVSSIIESGMEPRPFIVQYLNQSGVNMKGAVAHELTNVMYSLWLMACSDGIDLHHSAAAEHMARRFLQSQMAIVRNPRNPDFDTLEMYMEHTRASGLIAAPRFEAEMAERMKSQAFVLKQMRLSRDEEQAAAKRQKNEEDGGKGKKEKEKEKAKAKAKGKGPEE